MEAYLQLLIFFVVPASFAVISLNKNREAKTEWGDCFLRAFTTAAKVFAIQAVVIIVALLIGWGIYSVT